MLDLEANAQEGHCIAGRWALKDSTRSLGTISLSLHQRPSRRRCDLSPPAHLQTHFPDSICSVGGFCHLETLLLESQSQAKSFTSCAHHSPRTSLLKPPLLRSLFQFEATCLSFIIAIVVISFTPLTIYDLCSSQPLQLLHTPASFISVYTRPHLV